MILKKKRPKRHCTTGYDRTTEGLGVVQRVRQDNRGIGRSTASTTGQRGLGVVRQMRKIYWRASNKKE
jgi:hypothetical protein